MLAPYSETARSKLSDGSGTSSALASISGNSMPNSAWQRRAVASCAGVTSTPTGRAPRRASQAETYAVPQPSSITSRPATSPSEPSDDSGTPKTPQVISAAAQLSLAFASVYAAFASVQSSRFRFASSEISGIG